MASSRYLISSTTVSGTTTASVAFSSIPSGYTDLCVKISVRANSGGSNANGLRLTINGSSANQSSTNVYGDGSAAGSTRGATYIMTSAADGSSATANTFSNVELYIPSYTASQNKPISRVSGQEDNVTTPAYIYADARLWSSTSAITDLSFDISGSNLASGSTFTLYGLKNS